MTMHWYFRSEAVRRDFPVRKELAVNVLGSIPKPSSPYSRGESAIELEIRLQPVPREQGHVGGGDDNGEGTSLDLYDIGPGLVPDGKILELGTGEG